MKTIKGILLFAFLFSPLLWKGVGGAAFAQCYPMIIIDGNNVIADNNAPLGLGLPTWLKAGQTLNTGQYVYSISVVELAVNGSALDYSQNLSITSPSTVPAGKVWKIEAVNKSVLSPSNKVAYTYSTPGAYSFTPICTSTFHVQAWGGGGGGGGGDSYCTTCSCQKDGGGGGSGGYAEGFYQLIAGTPYTITIGAGGAAGAAGSGGVPSGPGGSGSSSSLSGGTISISATGGMGGTSAIYTTNPPGGTGGSGSGQLNFSGMSGSPGGSTGGKGGDGANNGGLGGASSSGIGNKGSSPGGGGGGAGISCVAGGSGAPGKVVISNGTYSGSTNTSAPASGTLLMSKPINQLVTTDGCNATYTYTVPPGKVFELKGAFSNNGGGTQTLYIGSSCGMTDLGWVSCYNQYSGNIATASSSLTNPFPQWFRAGTVFYSTGCCGGTQGVLISGIEWIPVP